MHAAPKIRFSRRPLASAIACLCVGVAPLAVGSEGATSAPVTHTVIFCNDPVPTIDIKCGSDDGTLRQALYCANDTDIVEIAHGCTSFTVATAPMIVRASSVTLRGPGDVPVVISGGGVTKQIVHEGKGTLSIKNLFITGGYYYNARDQGGGGCISSQGSVSLDSVDVGNCILIPAANNVGRGGAIYAHDQVTLTSSTVMGSSVGSAQATEHPVTKGQGGGIWGASVSLTRSSVTGNKVGRASPMAIGGGVFAINELDVDGSTIALNFSTGNTGGASSGSLNMLNSTVAYNTSTSAFAGVYARSSATAIASTISKNASAASGSAAGLYTPSSNVRLNSSIFWENRAGGAQNDLFVLGVTAGISSNNLVGVSNNASLLPPDTISSDPELGPLQDNGGPTFTMAPSATSPVIDRGNNTVNAPFDQRGLPRVAGFAADIGALELDVVFANSFEKVAD